MKLHKALTGSTVPLGAARSVLGVAVLMRPTLLAATLGMDAATAQRTAWIARLFASRDLALGVGAVGGSRGCRVVACASDASDFVALVFALRAKQIRPVPGLLAAVTAAAAASVGGAALLVTRG